MKMWAPGSSFTWSQYTPEFQSIQANKCPYLLRLIWAMVPVTEWIKSSPNHGICFEDWLFVHQTIKRKEHPPYTPLGSHRHLSVHCLCSEDHGGRLTLPEICFCFMDTVNYITDLLSFLHWLLGRPEGDFVPFLSPFISQYVHILYVHHCKSFFPFDWEELQQMCLWRQLQLVAAMD